MTMTEKIMDSCGVRSSKTDRVAISVTTTADAVVVVGVSAVGRVVVWSFGLFDRPRGTFRIK